MGKRVLDNIFFKINLEKRNFPKKDLDVVGNFIK